MGAYREDAALPLVLAQLKLGGWVQVSWLNARRLCDMRNPDVEVQLKYPHRIWVPFGGADVHRPRTQYRARRVQGCDGADIIAEYTAEYALAVEVAAAQIWASIHRYEGDPTFEYQMIGHVMEEIER